MTEAHRTQPAHWPHATGLALHCPGHAEACPNRANLRVDPELLVEFRRLVPALNGIGWHAILAETDSGQLVIRAPCEPCGDAVLASLAEAVQH